MVKIKDFINKDNWTQEAFARDKSGCKVYFNSKQACKWCLEGMIFKLYKNSEDASMVVDEVQSVVGTIMDWNDDPGRTWEEVKALAERLNI